MTWQAVGVHSDMPPQDVWASKLMAQPFRWFQVAVDATPDEADELVSALAVRGCAARIVDGPDDGLKAVEAAFVGWAPAAKKSVAQ